MGNGHGGKRKGAGRKRGAIKQLTERHVRSMTRAKADHILGLQDEYALWARHLHSQDERIALDALKFLTMQADGRPFMSSNPNASKQERQTDPRLLEAMKRFLPQGSKVTVTQQIALQTPAAGGHAEQQPIVQQAFSGSPKALEYHDIEATNGQGSRGL